jgi:peptidoglycan/LPS O-acetylase OafA/YrhL
VVAKNVASGHQEHIVELQSMRGIAAFLVVMNHSLSFFQKSSGAERVVLLANGHAAVVFFFVLSGFVLSASLSRKAMDRQAITKYFLKRVFRIYPAVWAASIMALAYVATMHYHVNIPHASHWFETGFFPPANFNVLHLVAAFAGLATFLIPPLWTITIELIASIFIPIFVFLSKKGPRLTACVIFLLLSVSFISALFSRASVFAYLVDFMIGTVIAVYSKFWIMKLERFACVLPWACLFSSVYLFVNRAIILPSNYDNPFSQLFEAAAASILVAAIGFRKVDIPLLRSQWLIKLGDGSFSLYLVHFTVMCVCGTVLDMILTYANVPYNGVLWSFALLLLTAFLSLPLAAAFYKLIELPGIRTGDLVITGMIQPH